MTSTVVRLVTEDGPVDEVSVRTPVLPPPVGLEVAVRDGAIEWRLPRLGPLAGADRVEVDRFVGSVPCVSRAPEGHAHDLLVQYLTAPPPTPFDGPAIDAMWDAVSQLPGPVPASAVGQGATSRAQARLGPLGVQWSALPQVLVAADQLLARWPRREHSEQIWRARDLPGGRENAVATLRSPRARYEEDGPLFTARLRATDAPWRTRAVAGSAHRLAALVAEAVGAEGEGVTAPLRAVADRAMPALGTGDPPRSSWPRSLRRFQDLASIVFRQVQAVGAGSQEAPLARLWELYEGWVLSRLVELLSADLATAPSIAPTLVGYADAGGTAPRPTWFATWETTDRRVTIWAQLRVGGNGPRIFNSTQPLYGAEPWLPAIRSVTSDLIPDAVLVAHATDGTQEVAVLDAKQRSGAMMSAGDAGSAGSKYLWGLRAAKSDAHILQRVVLFTPATRPKMHDPPNARIHVVTAFPGFGPEPDLKFATPSS